MPRQERFGLARDLSFRFEPAPFIFEREAKEFKRHTERILKRALFAAPAHIRRLHPHKKRVGAAAQAMTQRRAPHQQRIAPQRVFALNSRLKMTL